MKTWPRRFYLLLAVAAGSLAQQPSAMPPELVRQGQQLTREGKLDEALALFRKQLQTSPDSAATHTAAGIVLDLMGRSPEARQHFERAIELAPDAQGKANAQRQMAMSYAFEGDCANTVKYEQQVFDYWVSVQNFYQQGEMANEAARVCIDSGDLDTAEKWYKIGYEVGLREPDIKPERVSLWQFRWAHAQARLAARRRSKDVQQHVDAAKAILDKDPEMAKAQAIFYPYLTGYVALYRGDYTTALADLQKANQNDAFIQCLTGDAYDKLGQKEKALEYYRKASAVTAHNPPAAYARRYTRKKLNEKQDSAATAVRPAGQ